MTVIILIPKMTVLLLFRNDLADKSAKKSVINLYPFRKEGHTPHSEEQVIPLISK